MRYIVSGFFHLAEWFCGSAMMCCFSIVHSYLLPNCIPLYEYNKFCLPIYLLRNILLFPVWGNYKKCCCEYSSEIFLKFICLHMKLLQGKCVHAKFTCWSPEAQHLRMWPYLEIVSLKRLLKWNGVVRPNPV